MPARSSSDRYGSVAIALHWISAGLIIGALIAGFRAAASMDLATKAAILRLHVPLGVAALVLTLVRIGWWVFADTKPEEIAGMPRIQSLAAKAAHTLLYVAILGLAVSGIGTMVVSGAGAILFGGAPGPLPNFWDYGPRYGHAAMARLMVVLLAVHIGAALYHHFVRRDGLLSRMGLGR